MIAFKVKLMFIFIISFVIFYEDIAFAHVRQTALLYSGIIISYQIALPLIYSIVKRITIVRFIKIAIVYFLFMIIVYKYIFWGLLSGINPSEYMGNLLLILIHIVTPTVAVHYLFAKIRN